MPTTTYASTGSFGKATPQGEKDAVDFEWWQATENLSPLPDAAPPRFPRRLDWEGREDGGWLALGALSAYGPCGCCATRPCLPQCPLQSTPPRTPEFWTVRWTRTAQDMIARGEEVNPLYRALEVNDET